MRQCGMFGDGTKDMRRLSLGSGPHTPCSPVLDVDGEIVLREALSAGALERPQKRLQISAEGDYVETGLGC